ncbi:MAG: tetratricopeptide repeat protein [Pyrinomonadaceae bacterium]
MKRCPECRRDYYDDTLLYCLDDGNALLEGPASLRESATAIFSAPGAAALTGEVGTAIFSSSDPRPDDRTSIAVLPFANISTDEENEYFCDGMAEELLNALSKIDKLKVAARTSAFFFKGKDASVREIGGKLGVKNVLEGSVRKSGNRLRISVQLVNVADGFHLWSESYDREMQDIFDLQDEITLSVVDALKVKLLGGEREVVLKRYTHNAEAYEFFLKGRFYHYKYTAGGWKRAIEFFEKAIEKEPNYAPAYAAMTSSWGCLWFFGLVSSEQAIPPMKSATVKGLEIDENLSESHLSQAMVSFFYDWEWTTAEQAFKKAIAIDPNNAEALSFYAMFLAFEERFDEALEQSRRSLAIDPLSPLINMNAGWTYFTAGLANEASDQVDAMIEIEPDFYGAYWLRGAIFLTEGKYDEAIEELKKGVSLGGHQTVLADLGAAYGLAERGDEAAEILNRLLELRQRDYVSAICIARVYSRIGENDKAIEWLEKAFRERNGEMLFIKGEIAGAADGDSLNSLGRDPRLIDLLQKMNLP